VNLEPQAGQDRRRLIEAPLSTARESMTFVFSFSQYGHFISLNQSFPLHPAYLSG